MRDWHSKQLSGATGLGDLINWNGGQQAMDGDSTDSEWGGDEHLHIVQHEDAQQDDLSNWTDVMIGVIRGPVDFDGEEQIGCGSCSNGGDR